MSLHAFFPREHGLWAWVGLPLLAALVLAPRGWPGAIVVLAVFLLANRLRERARFRRTAWLEVPGICAFAAAGAGVAVLGGADLARAIAVEAAVAAWGVIGLWWVRRALEPVLPKREPWREGPRVAAGAVAASVAIGVATGHPVVGAVPVLYALRAVTAGPVTSARDAKRVGLVELGWGVAAALACVLLPGSP